MYIQINNKHKNRAEGKGQIHYKTRLKYHYTNMLFNITKSDYHNKIVHITNDQELGPGEH